VLTFERLHEVLHYDPDTGVWTWLARMSSRAPKGARAGSVHRTGYRHIRIDGERHRAHRLAFFYMTGSWPANEVDHKNVVPGDDRWVNLREATASQNQANRKLSRANTSGRKGVSWSKIKQRWVAHIQVRGRQKNLGAFDSLEEACATYSAAAADGFGDFARLA
jgi:hypothetical protein